MRLERDALHFKRCAGFVLAHTDIKHAIQIADVGIDGGGNAPGVLRDAGVAPGLERGPALDVLPGDPIGVCNRIPSGDGTYNRSHGSLPDFNRPRNLTGKLQNNASGLRYRAACLTDQDVPVRIFCKRRGFAADAGDDGAGKSRTSTGDDRGTGGLPGQKVNFGERVLIDTLRSLGVEHVREEQKLAVLVLHDGRF